MEADLEQYDPVPKSEMPLDPWIRRYVLVLRSRGIETFESCQGGPGHPFPEPTVRFHGNAFEGYRAFAEAMNHGLPVLSLRYVYHVNEMRLEGPWWEMTFRSEDGSAASDADDLSSTVIREMMRVPGVVDVQAFEITQTGSLRTKKTFRIKIDPEKDTKETRQAIYEEELFFMRLYPEEEWDWSVST